MDLDVRMDLRGALLSLAELSDTQGRRGINRSLNLAANSTGALASKEIRSELNLKPRELQRGRLIKVKRASGNVSEARVTISGARQPLTQFVGTRQTATGLSVRVFKSSSRKILKGRFVYGRAGRLAAERQTVGGKRVPRGPVSLLFGPGASQFASKPEVMGKLEAHARERFALEFERDVAFRLSKARAKSGGDG